MRYLPFVLVLAWPASALAQVNSPPEGRIAFTRVRENVMVPGDFRREAEIWVMNADGSGQRRLTTNTSDDFGIAWSPDGTRLLFGASQFEPDSSGQLTLRSQDILVIDVDGRGQPRRFAPAGMRAQFPSWSADGGSIVFHGRDGALPQDIFVMDSAGGNVRRLTRDASIDARPSWSPDGRRIAFQSDRDGSFEIHVMDADGSNVTQLTHGDSAVASQAPAWSPDGKRILFQRARGGNTEIHVMNADGSGETRLTTYPLRDLDAEWAGNDFILFDRDLLVDVNGVQREVKQIFRMRADGSDLVQITSMPASNSHAAWYGRW